MKKKLTLFLVNLIFLSIFLISIYLNIKKRNYLIIYISGILFLISLIISIAFMKNNNIKLENNNLRNNNIEDNIYIKSNNKEENINEYNEKLYRSFISKTLLFLKNDDNQKIDQKDKIINTINLINKNLETINNILKNSLGIKTNIFSYDSISSFIERYLNENTQKAIDIIKKNINDNINDKEIKKIYNQIYESLFLKGVMKIVFKEYILNLNKIFYFYNHPNKFYNECYEKLITENNFTDADKSFIDKIDKRIQYINELKKYILDDKEISNNEQIKNLFEKNQKTNELKLNQQLEKLQNLKDTFNVFIEFMNDDKFDSLIKNSFDEEIVNKIEFDEANYDGEINFEFFIKSNNLTESTIIDLEKNKKITPN